MKKVFFETVRNGLVPVKVNRKMPQDGLYEIQITETTAGYEKNDVVHCHRRYLVNKAGFNENGFQLVKQADLSKISE